jgi:hypothetical protein
LPLRREQSAKAVILKDNVSQEIVKLDIASQVIAQVANTPAIIVQIVMDKVTG